MSAPAARPPIRLGLLADAGPQPWWVAELLRELIGDGTVELVLVVRADSPPPEPREGSAWRRRLFYGLYALHERLENLLKQSPRPALLETLQDASPPGASAMP